MSLFLTACRKKDDTPSNFDMTDMKEEQKENTSTSSASTNELNLTPYQQQSTCH